MIQIPKEPIRILGIIACLLGGDLAIGQQWPLHGFLFKTPFGRVAAYAGNSGTAEGAVLYRNQWQGLEGNPQTFTMMAQMPVYWYSVGAGLVIGKDESGLSNRIFAMPCVSKMGTLGPWLWSVGLQLDYSYHRFNGQQARTPDGNYQGGNIDHQDPLLASDQQSFQLVDANLSLALQRDLFRIAITGGQLFESARFDAPAPFANRRTFSLHSSYQWKYDKWQFEPGIFMISDLIHLQTELFLSAEYNGNIFGGIQYRGFDRASLESLGFAFGFHLSPRWSVGYLHEFYLGGLDGTAVQQSQEFGIWYRLGKPVGQGRKPIQLISPRYFD